MGDDVEVERRLTELDELLGRVEQLPGPAGELALEAVAAVVEIYGAALSRALLLARSPEAFTSDPLLGHLLLVHGLHPDPVDVRVRRGPPDLGPPPGPPRPPPGPLRGAPGGAAGLGGAGGTAQVRVTAGGGCGSPDPGELEQALQEVVLAAAPELARIETVAGDRPVTFVPLDSLLRAPAPSGVPS